MNEVDYFSEEGKAIFHKEFWDRKVLMKDDPRVMRIEGVHYIVSAEPTKPTNGDFLGHGGREFRILTHDGRSIGTHNLWCQGEIPPEYREQLPDNAVFTE